MATPDAEKTLMEVLVVHEYVDVFPEYLLGILPNRSVEFTIDLISRAAPVSKAPYIFLPYLDQFMIVLIYDILVYSNDREQHEKHLDIVLETLRQEKLYVKFKKCKFWFDWVVFLRHIVIIKGIKVDPTKVEDVEKWLVFLNANEMRCFLGLVGYYRKFIGGFSKHSRPDYLTHKEM
ncbi:hypothetical protein DH2020_020396 [Rehmannia glutinosa]|uniref:Reverse transcriptase domain-containing protein n=1 Tax=Rehmannia glutinosa TaxID=99300 RepID=A0ABR0WGJ8_REHGL